jgi:hypothetical protein
VFFQVCLRSFACDATGALKLRRRYKVRIYSPFLFWFFFLFWIETAKIISAGEDLDRAARGERGTVLCLCPGFDRIISPHRTD